MYSSEIMLSDENKLNKINPYMDGLIAWTKPYRYEKASPIIEPKGIEGDEYHVLPDDTRIDGAQLSNCKMVRAMSSLEPTREIQPDFQTGFIDQLLGNTWKPKDKSFENPAQTRGGDIKLEDKTSTWVYILIAIVAIVLLFLMVKR